MRTSLVITAYNAAWCIERAFDSVFAGTRLPDEVMLADDGSTDDTVARVEARYGPRVRVLRLPHRGLTPTRRASFEAATGDWIAPMDADDEWLPEKHELQVAFLEAHPAVRWCTTDGVYVSAEGVIRDSWLSDYFSPLESRAGDVLAPLAQRCFPLVSSMMVERRAYESVGGFDTSFNYSQDYDLWLRLAAAHPCGILAEPLIRYWASPGQMSRKVEARFRDDLALMERLASGALRDDPAIRRIGEARAAALAFEIALLNLKSGGTGDVRKCFARAAGSGPPGRRLLSALGAAIPTPMMTALVGASWLRGMVSAARRPVWRVDAGPPPGESA